MPPASVLVTNQPIYTLQNPLPEDEGSSRCRVSNHLLKERKITIGRWVRIETIPDEKEKDNRTIIYCKIWPDPRIADGVVQADTLLSIQSFGSSLSLNKRPSCSITPLKNPLEIAVEIVISPSLRVDQSQQQEEENELDMIGIENQQEAEKKQLDDFGFVWKDASLDVKINTIRDFLKGLVVCNGCVVRNQKRCLEIQILFTTPKNAELLVSSATQITLSDNRTIKTSIKQQEKNDGIEEVISSIKSISLGEKDFLKEIPENNLSITTSIPGLEKAYESLLEIVSYPLLYPHLLKRLNIECPKGVLLYGPPGVGKTYLVATISKAFNAKMVKVHGSEIYGPYVGESEAKLREKFKFAEQLTLQEDCPVILFIDEVDALTPHRKEAQIHESRVVAQLLTLMDGMESRGRLVIIAATNRPNAIDPALRRPGRFDREISIDVPTEEDRQKILRTQTRKMPLNEDVNLEILAKMTNGYERERKDFENAMGTVRPSLQRGFYLEIEKTTWEDIGGLEDVKKKLKQAVEWPIKYRQTFERLGLLPPRGILLYGPPGCSKTTLVKVIASTSGATFLSLNGAQLYSSLLGDSEKHIRVTFQRARSATPSIVFFDEIDAIVGKRLMGETYRDGTSGGGGDSVQERVLSMLLNEMDGVESATSVLVVGATNRPDMLDAALLRPGRFDKLVYVPPPDLPSRRQILAIHTLRMPLLPDVDLDEIAQQTNMYTGADLKNVCREAAMTALRESRDADQVTMNHFLEALKIVRPSLTEEMLGQYKDIHKKYI
ncbi:hypothetical protein G9A89_016756 [Geosiphon pyriformis]|nr:hypothetical protein G9A89_016756 [Geosiphon pyriformis]